ncbi:hypothetical protein QF001_003442 [Paraburkholderia youngii]
MKPDRRTTDDGRVRRHGRLAALSVPTLAIVILAGCGGSDGGSSASAVPGSMAQVAKQAQAASAPQTPSANQPYTDLTSYSTSATSGIASSLVTEKAAIMHYQWTSGSTTID